MADDDYPDRLNTDPSLGDSANESSANDSSSDHSEPPLDMERIPRRPKMLSRKSSGPLVVPRDSSAVGPVDSHYGPDDVRAMSPRRTGEDLNRMGKEVRQEMQSHARQLQDSLGDILDKLEALKEKNDKLDNYNKFLQRYIGDLMSTSKITASGSRGRR